MEGLLRKWMITGRNVDLVPPCSNAWWWTRVRACAGMRACTHTRIHTLLTHKHTPPLPHRTDTTHTYKQTHTSTLYSHTSTHFAGNNHSLPPRHQVLGLHWIGQDHRLTLLKKGNNFPTVVKYGEIWTVNVDTVCIHIALLLSSYPPRACGHASCSILPLHVLHLECVQTWNISELSVNEVWSSLRLLVMNSPSCTVSPHGESMPEAHG